MDDYRTRAFEPEPDLGDEWDYDEAPAPAPKILWGRIAALGAAIVVAFLLGRAAAPEGISEEQLASVKAARDQAQEENETLRTQLDAAQEAANRAEQQAETETEQPTDAGTPVGDVRRYTIQPGDTLTKIAESFYGDAEKADLIKSFNSIEDPDQLEIGDELLIPPEDLATED